VNLREAWDGEAADWVRWARSPGLDHAFWRMNLPALLALLPEPGELTVDVGCGEGRVARRLRELGHTVVGVEGSPALAAAARAADPELEVHVADAAAMPLGDGVADLAVASMSLMNMDDPPAVVREVARVLRPRGVFCLSILHPVNTWDDAPGDGYFDTVVYAETVQRDGARMTFHDTHRPLGAYAQALEAAGFAIEVLREPVPDAAHVADHPDAGRWRRRPGFLHLRARLSDPRR
jgi:SAM-dependent methyltransferase